MTKAKRLLLTAVGLVLAGCSTGPTLPNGHVIATDYDPAWAQPIPQPNGGVINIYHSETCWAQIKGWTGGSEGQGEVKEEWVIADCEDNVQIGDYLDFEED